MNKEQLEKAVKTIINYVEYMEGRSVKDLSETDIVEYTEIEVGLEFEGYLNGEMFSRIVTTYKLAKEHDWEIDYGTEEDEFVVVY